MDVSQGVVADYEANGVQRPDALLAALARVLKAPADELLGLKLVQEKPSPKAAPLPERMQKIADLSPADQRTVLTLLDALHESRQRTSRPRAKARAAS